LTFYWKLAASSSKPKSVAELKQALQVIWDNLPKGPISFTERLKRMSESWRRTPNLRTHSDCQIKDYVVRITFLQRKYGAPFVQ